MDKLKQLYITINELMCKLGAEGEINTRQTEVDAVMNALWEIDGGVYDPDIDLTKMESG